MTEAQENNHTDRVDPSPRMPRGQLMWRAVTYTHQGGAGGNNSPLPSRKKFSLFLGTPSYVCMCNSTFISQDLLYWWTEAQPWNRKCGYKVDFKPFKQ